MFVPVDRKIHELITILKIAINELSEGYFKDNEPYLYNKTNGIVYNMNLIIKDSDNKIGTRLMLA